MLRTQSQTNFQRIIIKSIETNSVARGHIKRGDQKDVISVSIWSFQCSTTCLLHV